MNNNKSIMEDFKSLNLKKTFSFLQDLDYEEDDESFIKGKISLNNNRDKKNLFTDYN